ncbi:MAG TPA: hypothetical protein VGH82_16615 [Gaiellaceae bacterium]|jgi:hypothetical protein
MPTRKQKRRDLKAKRHEYEFVYVDDEGNEVDEPEEADAPAKQASATNGSKPKQPAAKKSTAASGRPRREPQAPSWKRAAKRSALLGVFVLIFFSFTAKGNLIRVLPTALLFSVAYVPVMYYIDRMAYRRFQGRGAAKTTTTKNAAAKKR